VTSPRLGTSKRGGRLPEHLDGRVPWVSGPRYVNEGDPENLRSPVTPVGLANRAESVGLPCARVRVGDAEPDAPPPCVVPGGADRDKGQVIPAAVHPASEGHWFNPPSHSAAQVRCVGQCVGATESEPRIRYTIVKAGTPRTRGGGEGQTSCRRLSYIKPTSANFKKQRAVSPESEIPLGEVARKASRASTSVLCVSRTNFRPLTTGGRKHLHAQCALNQSSITLLTALPE
jgi:hypothetical protein